MNDRELISIVVPVHNEEGNLRKLYDALVAELARLDCDWEMIFVDDGSCDESASVIKSLCTSDVRVRLVGLSRNFGTQSAIFAGLEHAAGAAAIVMDADLQHPPSLISMMLAHWRRGYDVVYAVREADEAAGLFKRLCSTVFSRLFNVLADMKVESRALDFRLLDRKVVDHLIAMKERNRFFRGLVSWLGFRQVGIPVVVPKRNAGSTKYRLRRLVSLALDAITSFSMVPLRVCSWIGLGAVVCTVPYALWAIYLRLFTDRYLPGWAAIVVGLIFFGGVQLLCLGILGEYVGRIYEEVKGRPLYIARERVGFDGGDAGVVKSPRRRKASGHNGEGAGQETEATCVP